jgi:hypothetical protein
MTFDLQTTGRLAIAILFLGLSCGRLLACPFCKAPSLTLAEQIENADIVRLLRLETDPSVQEGKPSRPLVCRFKVIDEFTIHAGRQTSGSTSEVRALVTPGQQVGDLFVLMQRVPAGRNVEVPLPISRVVWNYLKSMPARDKPTTDRLKFFVRYLEHPESIIANDAYGEFANAPYEDIVAIRDTLPRTRLRQWVFDSRIDRSVIETRLGLYGMLLGLCGNQSDASLLKRVIVDDWKSDDDFRLGIDGMIGGYLLLTGEDGLEIIERTKLTNPDVSFAETYAGMQALRFAWTYGDGVIKPERLRKAMRLLLERPELTDLVIADLARWKDWEIQSRLMQMYDEEAYQVTAVKRAIIRFMLVSSRPAKSKSSSNGQPATEPSTPPLREEIAADASGVNEDTESEEVKKSEPAHVTQGRRYLSILRERDPKTVTHCERFFIF